MGAFGAVVQCLGVVAWPDHGDVTKWSRHRDGRTESGRKPIGKALGISEEAGSGTLGYKETILFLGQW